jgi:hypothetical protein
MVRAAGTEGKQQLRRILPSIFEDTLARYLVTRDDVAFSAPDERVAGLLGFVTDGLHSLH